MRPLNLLSARSRHSAVTTAVALEVSRGHTTGLFVCPLFRLFHCSPLGTAERSDGSVRLVLGLSSPRGALVNSGIPREEFVVRYASMDAAVAIVCSLGRNVFVAKADICHGFAFALGSPRVGRSCATCGKSGYMLTSGSLLGPALPPSFLLISRRRFTGLPDTFAGAAASSITSMIIFWCGPPMLRAPVTCKLSRTSAATSLCVSPLHQKSWSCQHAASSSWASPWTPLFRGCASLQTNLHGFAIASPHGGRSRNAPSGSCCC